MARRRFHRHRIPRRFLSEIPSLPQFLPGVRPGALLQSSPQIRRLLRVKIPAQRVPAAQRVLSAQMRTPLRLAITVLQARLSQSTGTKKKYPPVHCIRIPDDGREAILSPTNAKLLAGSAVPRRRHTPRPAPVVWLTSTAETLEHSSISRLTRELQDSRRFVFLETDGQQLRRRIHEFRPDNRLYLTIRLYGTAATHDLRVGKPGAFSLAMEGIRAAQLSGYLVCVHVVINAETKMPDIMALIHELVLSISTGRWSPLQLQPVLNPRIFVNSFTRPEVFSVIHGGLNSPSMLNSLWESHHAKFCLPRMSVPRAKMRCLRMRWRRSERSSRDHAGYWRRRLSGQPRCAATRSAGRLGARVIAAVQQQPRARRPFSRIRDWRSAGCGVAPTRDGGHSSTSITWRQITGCGRKIPRIFTTLM